MLTVARDVFYRIDWFYKSFLGIKYWIEGQEICLIF